MCMLPSSGKKPWRQVGQIWPGGLAILLALLVVLPHQGGMHRRSYIDLMAPGARSVVLVAARSVVP